jgi:hypothetical protein
MKENPDQERGTSDRGRHGIPNRRARLRRFYDHRNSAPSGWLKLLPPNKIPFNRSEYKPGDFAAI